eukprot:scaffold23131_cov61-Phaeocystis_antarctica.AAC.5
MRSLTSERRAPPTLTLKRAMLRGTADGSLRSMAGSADMSTWPHSIERSKQAVPSSLTLTPNDARAGAQATCSPPPSSGAPGGLTVQCRSPLNTSKSTPSVRPVAGSQMARCSRPSNVSVILPWAKPGFTGKNCAFSEMVGAEMTLKYFHRSPRTWNGTPSIPTKVGSSPAVDAGGCDGGAAGEHAPKFEDVK